MGTMIAISRWGNSLGIRIPKALLESAHLHEGDALVAETTDDGILLRPAAHLDLTQMIAAITPENLHAETDTGRPIGHELW